MAEFLLENAWPVVIGFVLLLLVVSQVAVDAVLIWLRFLKHN